MRETQRSLVFCAAMILALSAACTLGAQPPTTQPPESDAIAQAALTLEARMTQDAGGQVEIPEGQPPEDQSAAGTATPEPTPTVALTPTPAVPTVVVSVDTNCRVGPGSVYDYLGALLVGESAEIVGLAPSGYDYVVIENPDASGNCWLWLEYATISGDTSGLPVMSVPPTPTPTFTPTPEFVWEGTWSMWVSSANPTVNITRSGNTISGSFNLGPWTVEFNGTISADGRQVSGTWTTTVPTSGSFAWRMKANGDQFVGNNDSTFEWCGARNGAPKPSPCLWP